MRRKQMEKVVGMQHVLKTYITILVFIYIFFIIFVLIDRRDSTNFVNN